MEVQTVTISYKEYEKLYESWIDLSIAENAVLTLRDDDGGLRLPSKCVDLLLQIMEDYKNNV